MHWTSSRLNNVQLPWRLVRPWTTPSLTQHSLYVPRRRVSAFEVSLAACGQIPAVSKFSGEKIQASRETPALRATREARLAALAASPDTDTPSSPGIAAGAGAGAGAGASSPVTDVSAVQQLAADVVTGCVDNALKRVPAPNAVTAGAVAPPPVPPVRSDAECQPEDAVRGIVCEGGVCRVTGTDQIAKVAAVPPTPPTTAPRPPGASPDASAVTEFDELD